MSIASFVPQCCEVGQKKEIVGEKRMNGEGKLKDKGHSMGPLERTPMIYESPHSTSKLHINKRFNVFSYS